MDTSLRDLERAARAGDKQAALAFVGRLQQQGEQFVIQLIEIGYDTCPCRGDASASQIAEAQIQAALSAGSIPLRDPDFVAGIQDQLNSVCPTYTANRAHRRIYEISNFFDQLWWANYANEWNMGAWSPDVLDFFSGRSLQDHCQQWINYAVAEGRLPITYGNTMGPFEPQHETVQMRINGSVHTPRRDYVPRNRGWLDNRIVHVIKGYVLRAEDHIRIEKDFHQSVEHFMNHYDAWGRGRERARSRDRDPGDYFRGTRRDMARGMVAAHLIARKTSYRNAALFELAAAE